MMRKNKNARHKINMVRKKREKKKGCSKEKGGESRNRKRRKREKETGPERSPTGQRGEPDRFGSREKKTKPVQLLYKG